MSGHNNTELNELRHIEENLEDLIARGREMLERSALVEELRSQWEEVTAKQHEFREKRRHLVEIHNRQHKEFMLVNNRCMDLEDELESAEDGIQARCFYLLDRGLEDTDAMVGRGVACRSDLTGWRKLVARTLGWEKVGA